MKSLSLSAERPMASIQDILEKIEKPLSFASQDEFRHLPLVKDLEPAMTSLLSRLKRLFDAEEKTPGETLSRFAVIFVQFDQLPLEIKKQRITEALDLFRRLQEAHGMPAGADAAVVNRRAADFDRLRLSVQFVKGVGPRIAALLAKKGLSTIEDMLYFLPRRYEDRRWVKTIDAASVGKRETVMGEVIAVEAKRYARRQTFEVTVDDGHSVLTAKWFRGHLGYLNKFFKTGDRVILTGDISSYRHVKNMIHPDFEVLDSTDSDLLHFKRIVPIYSETEGLRQKTVRRLMMHVVENYADAILSPIPREICSRRSLMDIREAFNAVHFPPQDSDIDQYNQVLSDAHRRLIFDEFFFFQLGMALKKHGHALDRGIAFDIRKDNLERFYHILPFRLTGAQQRVIGEIEGDMARAAPMNRLLQGDVGCGKTVVAMAAMITACENGYQAAIMAPTEILAQQHYRNIISWAENLALKAVLLTASASPAERGDLYEDIERGETHIIVGTHALIQEKLSFKKLGMVIIDEQHRFGVLQRAALRGKGYNPDVLVMTATPIPRTLAMTVYGDLDVSVIDEMPPGKKPVRTKIFYEQHRSKVYDMVRRELQQHNQVFIVYPLVEESENLDLKDATRMAQHLKNDIFPDYRVGLIHGRMKAREKEKVMSDFLKKKIHILVATTVIEVGIDIPQASLMVIEHAERFGLSQLHQLRGRVGRSDIPSSCILLAQHTGSEDARKRLRVMEETYDGFQIAEADLTIRGPGEFMGIRQSGLPDFRVANILRDAKILNEAKTDAFCLAQEDPFLDKQEHRLLKEVLLHRWSGRLDIARTG